MAVRSVLCLAVSLGLSGCAHSVLYDENRDKQAQAAQSAVTEAHVAATVTSLEQAFADVAAREEANARDNVSYLFDEQIRGVSKASSLDSKFDQPTKKINGLLTTLEERAKELGMGALTDEQMKEPVSLEAQNEARMRSVLTDKQMTELVSLEAQGEALTRRVELELSDFRGNFRHGFKSCTEAYAASSDPTQKSETPSAKFLATLADTPDGREIAALEYAAVIQACTKLDEVAAKRKKFYRAGGGVDDLYVHADKLDHEIALYNAELQEAKKKLAVAVGAAEAPKAATKPADPTLASVEERAKSVAELIAALKQAGGPDAHALASERLKHLQSLLTAIAGTPPDASVKLSDDDRRFVAIVRGLPQLQDEADTLLKDAAKPRLVPFLAAIDQQKIIIQGFEAAQAAKRKQAAAARSQLHAAIDEGNAIARILRLLEANPSWSDKSIADLERTLPAADKSVFHRVLATYADDVKRYRVDGAVWQVRELAAQHEVNFAQSKANAAQWDNLMDLMAKVLADYHAAGIKRSDITELFKALGLVAIGVGVAQ